MISAWAAFAKSIEVRKSSSSGGIFNELACDMIDNEGVVYGVAMSLDNKLAEYLRINAIYDLSRIKGSKYLQAKIGDTFSRVKEDLDKGVPVLFSGTSCTINGLKMFLGKDYDNLFCIDVICHGVSSPSLWKTYIEYIENKTRTTIATVCFRYKLYEWKDFFVCFTNKDNEQFLSYASGDPYMQLFLNNISLRPSCYECKAKDKRYSDISLGDFWGIDEVSPGFADNWGTSLVIVRSDRGKKLLDRIDSSIVRREVSYKDVIKYNPSEFRSVSRPSQRDTIFEDYLCCTIPQLCKKYIRIPVRIRIKNCLINIKLVRKIIEHEKGVRAVENI